MNWLRGIFGSILPRISNQRSRNAASVAGAALREETDDVIESDDGNDEEEDAEPNRVRDVFEVTRLGLHEEFAQHEEHASAVERGEREDVEHGKTEAEERDEAQ